jgi:hypothetical protein
MSMDNHGGMISTGETLDTSTSILWKFYQQSLVTNPEELDEGSDEFGLTKLLYSYFEGICNMP